MWLPESESPTTGQGRRASSKTSFRGLTQRTEQYAPPPFVASVQARKNAISWRYREARRHRSSAATLFVRWRLAELERIIRDRWGHEIPAAPAGEIFVRVAVNHLVGFSKHWRKKLDTWCDSFAPWLDEDVLDEMIDLAAASPTLYRPDSLARIIRLDIETRDRLQIKTIGAFDFDKKARDKRRLTSNAARKRQKRAERGATPRTECISRQKPWLAEGLSRTTWYRRKKDRSV